MTCVSVRATSILCLLGFGLGLGSVLLYRLYTRFISPVGGSNGRRKRSTSPSFEEQRFSKQIRCDSHCDSDQQDRVSWLSFVVSKINPIQNHIWIAEHFKPCDFQLYGNLFTSTRPGFIQVYVMVSVVTEDLLLLMQLYGSLSCLASPKTWVVDQTVYWLNGWKLQSESNVLNASNDERLKTNSCCQHQHTCWRRLHGLWSELNWREV